MKPSQIATLMLLLLFGAAAWAQTQQVRIRVVEPRRGKPVADECLNISFGSWHGPDLVGATNADGIVVLNIDKDQASVEPVPGKTCSYSASTRPVHYENRPKKFAITTLYYVSCINADTILKRSTLDVARSSEWIPTFVLTDIMAHGIFANGCGKLVLPTKPGELVLVVRNS